MSTITPCTVQSEIRQRQKRLQSHDCRECNADVDGWLLDIHENVQVYRILLSTFASQAQPSQPGRPSPNQSQDRLKRRYGANRQPPALDIMPFFIRRKRACGVHLLHCLPIPVPRNWAKCQSLTRNWQTWHWRQVRFSSESSTTGQPE